MEKKEIVEILEGARALLAYEIPQVAQHTIFLCWCIVMAYKGDEYTPSRDFLLSRLLKELPPELQEVVNNIGSDVGAVISDTNMSFTELQELRFMYISFIIERVKNGD